jgi:hypothetical protein
MNCGCGCCCCCGACVVKYENCGGSSGEWPIGGKLRPGGVGRYDADGDGCMLNGGHRHDSPEGKYGEYIIFLYNGTEGERKKERVDGWVGGGERERGERRGGRGEKRKQYER